MWKSIIKKEEEMCVRCKKESSTYSIDDQRLNETAEAYEYEPWTLCDDCKIELVERGDRERAFD